MTLTAFASPGALRPARALLLGTAFTALVAGAASAETLTVTGIGAVPGALYGLSVPTVEVVDGNLNEGTVRGLFTGAPGSLDALSTLDAASVTVPELTFTIPGVEGAAPTVVTYRDIAFNDVADGVAGSAVVGSAEVTGAENLVASFGEMSTGRFDIGALLGFYGIGANAGSTEMQEIYADFRFSGGTIGSDEFSCEIGAANVGSFTARPLLYPLSDINATVLEVEAAQQAGTPPSPETIGKLVRFYVDLLTAYSTSPFTFDGFTCSGKDEKGNPITVASGPISAGGFQPAVYPEVSLDDFRIEAENDGFLQFGNFTWKQMDFTNAIETLKAAVTFDDAFFSENWRKLVPEFDGLRLTDLDMDVPDSENPEKRVTARLGAFEASLADYVNGIPSDIALRLANLIVPITPDLTDMPVADLLARGITQFDVSVGSHLRWDEPTSTIAVNDLSLDLGPLGRIAVSGTLGNATPALFSDSSDEAMAASAGLTLKDVTIEIEDRGLASVLYAAGAREAGQPEGAFRAAVAGMAQGMTMAFLGNTEEALLAARELGEFLNGASHIKMTITAIDDAGIGLPELAALETNPTALSGKVTVTAEADGEPVTLPLVQAPASVQDQKRNLKAPATGQ